MKITEPFASAKVDPSADDVGERLVDQFASLADETWLPETIYPDEEGWPHAVAMGEDPVGPWGKPGIVTVLPARYFIR